MCRGRHCPAIVLVVSLDIIHTFVVSPLCAVLGSHQPIDRDDTRTDRSLDDDCSHIMYLPTILIRIDYIHLGFPYIEYLCALLKRFSESPLQISYLWTWNNKKLTKKGL